MEITEEYLKRQKLKKKIKENLEAFCYLFPAFSILFVFLFIPAIYAVIISLHKGNPIEGFNFVGLKNYLELLTNDMDFYKGLINTIYYAMFSIPLQIICGISLALLLNRSIRGISIIRVIYFIPHITSLVAVAMVWKWLFNEQYGLINYIVTLFGLEKIKWFNDPQGVIEKIMYYCPLDIIKSTYFYFINSIEDSSKPMVLRVLGYMLKGPSFAMFTIITLSVWKLLGYTTIIFLAGLQNIDNSYYEAAEIDGATRFQQFKYITWPLLSPATFFILIIGLIASFKVFVPMMIMTAGAPENTTLSVVYYLYQQAWIQNKMGKASAIAFILFFIILLFTIIQRMTIEKRVHYDA